MVKTRRKAKTAKEQPSGCLSNVPENVLVDIYKHLPMHQRIQGERVCMRFRNVLKNHAFRDVTKLEYSTMLKFRKKKQSGGKGWRYIGIRILQQLFARCGRYLTEVDLSQFPQRLRPLVFELCATCPRITKINFTGTYGYECCQALVNLGNALKNLAEVNFTGVSFGSFGEIVLSEFFTTQRCLRVVDLNRSLAAGNVLKYLTSIEALNLSGCQELRQDDILSLKDGCPTLKELDISNIRNLVRDSDLQFVGWPRLEALWFNDYQVYYYQGQGHSITFNDMPALKECHLRLNGAVNDQTLRTLCIAAPHLVVLDLYSNSLSYHRRLSDYSLSCISNLRCLEQLVINYTERFTEQHLMSIAVHGRLQYCMLSNCRQIGNNAIRYLLDTCKGLTYLSVSNTSVTFQIAPDLLAYADEFEKDRPMLEVTPGNQKLQNKLNRHPNITCVPEED